MTGITPKALADFNRALERFAAKEVPERLVDLHEKVSLQVLSGVVFKTPVDTGRARGGWQTEINSIPQGTTPRVDPGGGATIESGAAVLSRLPPFSIVYVANNVRYILPLERGSSKQAPRGMAALTVEEVKSQFP